MSDELPGMLATAKGVAKQEFPHTMDAQVWAEEFVKTYPMLHLEGVEVADVKGVMFGWFANAIMAGYDTANARLSETRQIESFIEHIARLPDSYPASAIIARARDVLKKADPQAPCMATQQRDSDPSQGDGSTGLTTREEKVAGEHRPPAQPAASAPCVVSEDSDELQGENAVLRDRIAELEAELARIRAAFGVATNDAVIVKAHELKEGPLASAPCNVEGPAHLCPKPAPGFELDKRGVLVATDRGPSAPCVAAPTGALADIASERRRQVEKEGWTAEHDEQHYHGDLAKAAACYAVPVLAIKWWPWDREWWKPKDQRRNLVRAGALIVAEIERLDRIHERPER